MNDATDMAQAMAERVHVDANQGLIHAASIEPAAALALFDGQGEVQVGRGRGSIRRVDTGSGRVVVRHYQRGGIVARLSRDRFVWTGADATRPFREFRVTRRLQALALPVPEVVAGRWQRSGPTYRADLATREIAGARTLAERLAAGDGGPDWDELGVLIARFHAVGLWHADLNAHNLLYDGEDRPWLIDFDRARFVAPWSGALQGNLDRLARSLRKLGHGALVAGDAWTRMHRAYDAAVQAGRGRR
jgi:3-deoxy-D-manno-octulosonic acid kinase